MQPHEGNGDLRRLLTPLLVFVFCPAAFAAPPGSVRSTLYRSEPCLAAIVNREDPDWQPTTYNGGSHWRPGTPFDTSRSYGLPQADPGSKMASAGADWRTNPVTQLRWMRGYVDGRYGSACAAWAFWQANGWY